MAEAEEALGFGGAFGGVDASGVGGFVVGAAGVGVEGEQEVDILEPPEGFRGDVAGPAEGVERGGPGGDAEGFLSGEAPGGEGFDGALVEGDAAAGPGEQEQEGEDGPAASGGFLAGADFARDEAGEPWAARARARTARIQGSTT